MGDELLARLVFPGRMGVEVDVCFVDPHEAVGGDALHEHLDLGSAHCSSGGAVWVDEDEHFCAEALLSEPFGIGIEGIEGEFVAGNVGADDVAGEVGVFSVHGIEDDDFLIGVEEFWEGEEHEGACSAAEEDLFWGDAPGFGDDISETFAAGWGGGFYEPGEVFLDGFDDRGGGVIPGIEDIGADDVVFFIEGIHADADGIEEGSSVGSELRLMS